MFHDHKAQESMQYVIFFVIFLAILGFAYPLFGESIFKEEIPTYSDNEFLTGITQLWNAFWGITDRVLSEVSQVTPITKAFYQICKTFLSTILFKNVHPYISVLVTALIGLPAAYIVIRLARGGG